MMWHARVSLLGRARHCLGRLFGGDFGRPSGSECLAGAWCCDRLSSAESGPFAHRVCRRAKASGARSMASHGIGGNATMPSRV